MAQGKTSRSAGLTASALRPYVVLRAMVPFLFSLLRDFRGWLIFGAPRILSTNAELARAQNFINRLSALGPSFVKFAQILAMREDFIPRIYTNILKDLHDRVPPFSTAEAHRIIRSDFGCDVADIFDDFSAEPVAAASLGQVYSAVYLGNAVAVKVLRPGVEQLVAQDLRVTRLVLWLARMVFGRHFIIMNLTAIADEFERMIADEMNFEVEARNADEIRRNVAGVEGVRIPAIYHEVTSQRVLTMEFIDGVRIDDVAAIEAMNIVPMELMKRLVGLYAQMIVNDGVSHADPHPGNLLVDAAGNVVLIDFGMVLRLSPDTRRDLMRTIGAVARGDVDAMVRGFYRLNMVTPGTNMVVLRDVAQVVMDLTYKTKHGTPRIVQEMVTGMLATFYRFPIHLPSNLVYLLRIATILEGIGLAYNDEFNGVRFSRPIIRRFFFRSGLNAPKVLLEEANEVWRGGMDFVRGLDRVVSRIDREELKIGVHPADMGEIERYFAGVQRRMIFGMLALAIAIVSAIVYTSSHSYLQLFLGEAVALGAFMLLLVVPVYRRWR